VRAAHRIDLPGTLHRVRVTLDGELLADTERGRVLNERGLPPRWYVPEEDLRSERLEPSDAVTTCPFKGEARYRSARVGDRLEEALAWTYPEPLPEVAAIAGHWCFYQERAEVEVDGEPQGR
jgi:uncharacterized protein (DUF427 family)